MQKIKIIPVFYHQINKKNFKLVFCLFVFFPYGYLIGEITASYG